MMRLRRGNMLTEPCYFFKIIKAELKSAEHWRVIFMDRKNEKSQRKTTNGD